MFPSSLCILDIKKSHMSQSLSFLSYKIILITSHLPPQIVKLLVERYILNQNKVEVFYSVSSRGIGIALSCIRILQFGLFWWFIWATFCKKRKLSERQIRRRRRRNAMEQEVLGRGGGSSGSPEDPERLARAQSAAEAEQALRDQRQWLKGHPFVAKLSAHFVGMMRNGAREEVAMAAIEHEGVEGGGGAGGEKLVEKENLLSITVAMPSGGARDHESGFSAIDDVIPKVRKADGGKIVGIKTGAEEETTDPFSAEEASGVSEDPSSSSATADVTQHPNTDHNPSSASRTIRPPTDRQHKQNSRLDRERKKFHGLYERFISNWNRSQPPDVQREAASNWGLMLFVSPDLHWPIWVHRQPRDLLIHSSLREMLLLTKDDLGIFDYLFSPLETGGVAPKFVGEHGIGPSLIKDWLQELAKALLESGGGEEKSEGASDKDGDSEKNVGGLNPPALIDQAIPEDEAVIIGTLSQRTVVTRGFAAHNTGSALTFPSTSAISRAPTGGSIETETQLTPIPSLLKPTPSGDNTLFLAPALTKIFPWLHRRARSSSSPDGVPTIPQTINPPSLGDRVESHDRNVSASSATEPLLGARSPFLGPHDRTLSGTDHHVPRPVNPPGASGGGAPLHPDPDIRAVRAAAAERYANSQQAERQRPLQRPAPPPLPTGSVLILVTAAPNKNTLLGRRPSIDGFSRRHLGRRSGSWTRTVGGLRRSVAARGELHGLSFQPWTGARRGPAPTLRTAVIPKHRRV